MDVTHDAALGGRLRLIQPKRGHRFGHDAILLAAAAAAKAGDRVVEFGAGVGAAGLALAARVPGIDLTLLEIEPALVELAARNIEANGFSASVRAITLDVTAANAFEAKGLPPDSADHVMMNPPFNAANLQASRDALRRRAHAADTETLSVWINRAAHLLHDGGTLTLIWRADTADDLVAALEREFGTVTVLPVHSIEGKEPIRVISSAVKTSEKSVTVLPGFVLNDRAKKPTRAAEAVLREMAPLALQRRRR